jgi:hypothetical protein
MPGFIFLFRKMDKERIDQNLQQFSILLLIGLILIFMLVGEAEVISSSAGSNKEGIILLSFSTIDKGFRSGIKERKLVTIKSEKEWENLWLLHKAPFAPERQIPLIDLRQEMIVAVFSGEKKTGGYGIEITKIEETREKGEVIVFFLETQPPSKAMVTQALTQPYHIVKTGRTNFKVKFTSGS